MKRSQAEAATLLFFQVPRFFSILHFCVNVSCSKLHKGQEASVFRGDEKFTPEESVPTVEVRTAKKQSKTSRILSWIAVANLFDFVSGNWSLQNNWHSAQEIYSWLRDNSFDFVSSSSITREQLASKGNKKKQKDSRRHCESWSDFESTKLETRVQETIAYATRATEAIQSSVIIAWVRLTSSLRTNKQFKTLTTSSFSRLRVGEEASNPSDVQTGRHLSQRGETSSGRKTWACILVDECGRAYHDIRSN